MRRGDPERIYQAQRAGFLGRMVASHRLPQSRTERIIDALKDECEALGIERDRWSSGARPSDGR
jgi:hypothetical protein